MRMILQSPVENSVEKLLKSQSIAPKNRIILDKKLRFLSEKGLIIHFSIALFCVYTEFGIAPS